jgi:hypothetical protein
MVRLKGKRRERREEGIINFNSTMVRLKEKEERKERGRNNKFQFHYGSIKGHMSLFCSV